MECNQAYESHYKTPFRIHHAEYPYPEDSSPSQSEPPVTIPVKAEQLENCPSSPNTMMSSSTTTTGQSSPLSVAGSHEYSEVGGKYYIYIYHL